METAFRKEGNAVIVSVKGRMDAVCSMDFEKALEDQVAAGETRFVIDFSGLEYISSAGLQCILTTAKMLEHKKGDILLTSLKGTVKDVFEISGFSSIFSIFDTVDLALAKPHSQE